MATEDCTQEQDKLEDKCHTQLQCLLECIAAYCLGLLMNCYVLHFNNRYRVHVRHIQHRERINTMSHRISTRTNRGR